MFCPRKFFLGASFALVMALCSASENRNQLPSDIIIGYASWGECDKSIVNAVRNGVNVVIWFAINLGVDENGAPLVGGGPNMDCVAETVAEISSLNLPTTHLISIGGWDAPHPSTANSAESMYHAWNSWNRDVVARPDKGWYGFAGFDWDIEGNDDLSSSNNVFTPECLDLMGKMSQLAKKDGYIVSIVPAESYLDPTESGFSRELTFNYREWESRYPNFTYHGRNCYAYLLGKYGIDTFDFVTIQLYESYSHAGFNITMMQQPVSSYLSAWVQSVHSGWFVNFSEDPDVKLSSRRVNVPASRLVIGLANGWAGGEKALLISPDDLAQSHAALTKAGLKPLGYAFWDIADEGRVSAQLGNAPLWLASGLNAFMNIRPPPLPCTYVVVSGDTLYAIASVLGTTVEIIEAMNPGIDPANLQIGQALLVPC